jgi:very-short-patch-repair endonuclease
MADVDDIGRRGGAQDRPRQRRLAELATRQHGVVGRRQLLPLGFTRDAIAGLLTRGQLIPIHRGVYAVGHRRLSAKGVWTAGVLACGPEAILSHRAALALHDLRPTPSGAVDVTVPGRTKKGRRGIRVHNVRALHADDRDEIDCIPVTEIHRALLDYAEIASRQQLRHAIDAGLRREVLDQWKFDVLFARSHGRHGLNPLLTTLEEIRGPALWTDSELERAFLALIRAAELEEPLTQQILEGERVDFFWPHAKFVVEVDGYDFHKSRAQFEADRRRDAKLMVAGYRVLRVTQQRIQFGSAALLSELIALLGAAAAGP